MKLKIFILSVIVFLFGLVQTNVLAQYPNLVFNQLTIKEGLPNGLIQCLIQDKQGYIWMCTEAGIVRYNGYQTKQYNFGNEDLENASVFTIYEDRSEKLWIGTQYIGLLFYDRAADSFRTFKPVFGNKISANFILQILDDGNQHLWVISYNQENTTYYLDKISLESGKIDHYSSLEKGAHHIDAAIFSDMIVSKTDKLWVGSNNGFYEYDPAKDSFTGHFANKDKANRKGYCSLLEDPLQPGVLWMSQSKNLNSFDWRGILYYGNEGVLQYNSNNNQVSQYRHTNNSSSIGKDTIYAIVKDGKNKLWFATNLGLSLFNPVQKNFENYSFPIQNNSTPRRNEVHIQPDHKGNVWYAGNNGIQYFDANTKRFAKFINRTKLPVYLKEEIYISRFLIDRNNTVWIGTYYGGLYWINEKASHFKFIKEDNAFPYGYLGGRVAAFSRDKDNTVWLANESSGFQHWFPQNDSFVSVSPDHSKNIFHGSATLLDSKGRLWLGTFDQGLYLHDPVTRKTVHYVFNSKDSNSISNDFIMKIFEDSKDRIWIGTGGGGLCLWRPETNDFKRYPYVLNLMQRDNNFNRALDGYFIIIIYEDHKGTIWVGTEDGGLNSLDETTNRFTSYYNQPLGFRTIYSALPTDSGNYYIGTFTNGLFLLDSKTNKVKKINENDGLIYNQAIYLLEDNDHNVWVGSQRGFSIMDAKTKRFRNIGQQNGLPEANISYAAMKDEDGKFIIGCENGILVFDPADFKPDTIVPLLHIEQLSFSNPRDKKKSPDSVVILYGKKEVRLSYKNNKVSFYYTALSYQDAALNQYSVWLDGYENNWVDMGTQRVATYNNLSPGTYTFHVKAANSDGVWTKTNETFTVIITPPWWRTWWAYILYALVFILAIWAFIAYRTAGIKREKEVLENKVSDRTTELRAAQNRLEMQSLRSQLNPHFMFNSLNAIQELILMEENEKSHSYLARFSKLLRMLLENTEKLFIPLQRELDFLQLYLSLEQLRIPELQFSLTVDPAIDTEQTVIPNMILQPYIENAIWHGLSHKPKDKRLEIRITKTNGAIQYEIEDNGVGRKKSAELKSLFRKEHKSKGMELLSRRFKLLSRELGADIETHYEDVMSNGEVAGTLVTIKVPVNFSEEKKDHSTNIGAA